MTSPLKVIILIPARYHSSRLPGKPLANILGKTLLARVWDIALIATKQAVSKFQCQISTLVLTEDSRIIDYCKTQHIDALLTSDKCQSGTERAVEAMEKTQTNAELIINLQGDNALCPPWFLTDMIESYIKQPAEVITPYVTLNWQELDAFRKLKETTPFSGTTVVFNENHEAIWFSKQVLPAIRNEKKLREVQDLSPVARHIGLYGFQRKTLSQYQQLKKSPYEIFEGLEQLTFIENDIKIKMVKVDYQGRQGLSGIDSPEDIERAEKIIAKDGEFISL